MNGDLKFKTSGKSPIMLEEYVEYSENCKTKSKINGKPVGVGSTRIPTNYGQSLPDNLHHKIYGFPACSFSTDSGRHHGPWLGG